MTRAELFAALGAALEATFDASWAVWAYPPDQTALPAVWPEYPGSHTAGTVIGTAQLRVIAAVAAQTSPAQYDRLLEAADLLDTIGADKLGAGVGITSRDDFQTTVTIGGVDQTALDYTFNLTRPLPC